MSALGRLFGRPPYVVVRPIWGLANRLRGVTSAWALARRLSLRFAIHWAPGTGFSDEGFGELFANDFELWDRERYEKALRGSAPVVSSWLGWKDRRPPHQGFDPETALDLIRRRGIVYDAGFHDLDVLLERRGVPDLRWIRRARRRCRRELVPAPAVARQVEAFASEHFAGRSVVGVHIRRGDALDSKRGALHRLSSDAAFAGAMTEAIAADDAVHFFLSTDCEKTQRDFAERFPGRILCAPKSFPESVLDEPKQGQVEALVDMLLLSRTQRVIGTRASTFGLLAANLGGVRFRAAGPPPADDDPRARRRERRQETDQSFRSSASLSR